MNIRRKLEDGVTSFSLFSVVDCGYLLKGSARGRLVCLCASRYSGQCRRGTCQQELPSSNVSQHRPACGDRRERAHGGPDAPHQRDAPLAKRVVDIEASGVASGNGQVGVPATGPTSHIVHVTLLKSDLVRLVRPVSPKRHVSTGKARSAARLLPERDPSNHCRSTGNCVDDLSSALAQERLGDRTAEIRRTIRGSSVGGLDAGCTVRAEDNGL